MRALAAIFLGLLALLVIGAVWQLVAGALDRRAHPPRGTFADAGGHRLFIDARARDLPGPTVLLECGIGGATSRSWAWVQRGVERFAPTVSYDRAGLGASEPGPMPRDGLRLVAELHAALGNAGVRPPYVYVGHSYGGLLARLFADRYPGEVVGVVLVESSHPRQFPTNHLRHAFDLIGALAPLAPWFARVGGMRAFFQLVHTDADLLPEPERSEQRAWAASPRHWAGVVRELAAWFPLTSPEAARTRDLGARPLAVLTAEASAQRWGPWGHLQGDLAGLSTDAIHRVVEGATHGSILADSSHAQHIVTAIHDVVDAVRTGASLRTLAAERGH